MTLEETDILVVGGGPAGLIASCEAAKSGAEVILCEEDTKIGQPCHCAGLLSISGMNRIGVPTQGPYILNNVKGARFFSPSGFSFTIEKSKPIACIVNRSLFDKFLAQKANEAGARINLDFKVQDIIRKKSSIIIRNRRKELTGKIVIDAEGVTSRTLKAVGLKPLEGRCLLPGLQVDLDNISVDPDYVEVHVGKKIAPNFFAWVIPLSERSARVGLGCKEMNPRDCLNTLIKARFGKKLNSLGAKYRGGVIVTCGPIKRTFDDHFLVVGDAAGHVKPTTGGGVIFGGICAQIAGEVSAEAVEKNQVTADFLCRYEEKWKKKLGKEFRIGLLARRILNNLTDEVADKIFKIILEEDLYKILSAEGDMDFQRSILLKILGNKEFLKIFPSLLRVIF